MPKPKVKKVRLDKLLVQRGLVQTRSKAQGLILAGDVSVAGIPVDKSGTAVPVDADIEIQAPLPYVGRGGYKLESALAVFGINVNDRICADVGACTGGFTDVLLQRGARRVYAIDVGYGQLDWKLRQDSRVIVMERTNARYLESLAEPVDFVSIDVAFISLKLILPAVNKWLTSAADIVALIKPQFEAGREQVGKGGIVKDAAVHQQVVTDLLKWARDDFMVAGLIRSPIEGAEGNVEFLVWLRSQGANDGVETAVIETLLEELFA